MATTLENIRPGSRLSGVKPGQVVTVDSARFHGGDVLEITYRDDSGALGQQLLFRNQEAQLDLVDSSQPWSFDADGTQLRLVSEAYRIQLAYLFDPYVAVRKAAANGGSVTAPGFGQGRGQMPGQLHGLPAKSVRPAGRRRGGGLC